MYHCIVNPSSRSGAGKRIWKETERTFRDQRIPYRVFFTRRSGHARKLAARIAARPSATDLLVIGGDGTLDEVINGLPLGTSLRLSYIPVGSGNDFARGMKLPKNPGEALERILTSKKAFAIDLGQLRTDGRYSRFATSAGLGYDAAVCYEASRTPAKKLLNRLHLGNLIYACTAIRLLTSFRTFSLEVTLEDGIRRTFDQVYFIAGMNLPYEGGGFQFCPKADPRDGKLDYIIVHHLPKWKVLLLFPLAFFGLHTHIRGITLLRGRSIKIKASSPQIIHHDGEFGGRSDTLTFATKKQVLDFL